MSGLHIRKARFVWPNVLLTSVLAWLTFGQETPITFEAASIKPSPPPHGPRIAMCSGGPATNYPLLFTCTKYSLASLIARAYDLRRYQLPQWNSGDDSTYELSARVPGGITKGQFRTMLQTLLADRFQLTYHYENRESEGFTVVVARGGPRVKETGHGLGVDVNKGETQTQRRGATDRDGYPVVASPQPGLQSSARSNGFVRWRATDVEMAQLILEISAEMDSPVNDATGLKGRYDFALSWVTSDGAGDDSPGPTLAEALQQQLGLKLERKKVPVRVFVIDHAEKTPLVR